MVVGHLELMYGFWLFSIDLQEEVLLSPISSLLKIIECTPAVILPKRKFIALTASFLLGRSVIYAMNTRFDFLQPWTAMQVMQNLSCLCSPLSRHAAEMCVYVACMTMQDGDHNAVDCVLGLWGRGPQGCKFHLAHFQQLVPCPVLAVCTIHFQPVRFWVAKVRTTWQPVDEFRNL